MIIDARNRGRVEFRGASEWGSSAIPMPGWGTAVYSGARFTTETALGLSAVGAAVRLISLLIASMDLCVFTGKDADKRSAEDSWQDKLLDSPNPDQSQFDLLSDIATGPETVGNSLVLKVRNLVTRRVSSLVPLCMDYAQITRDPRTKEKTIKIIVDGVTQQLSPSEVLHFRGWTMPGAVAGLSPIAQHRQALGNALALQEFEGRFFSNNTSPGGAIVVPGAIKRDRALEMLDIWEATHGGLINQHRPAMLTNGATWQSIGLSLQDAQFVEAQRYGVEQVARIWGIAPEMLGHPLARPEATEQLGLRLLNFTILPRLRRIEQTFAGDPDLFGLDAAEYPQFVTDDLLRTDALTAANVEHMQIQDGTKLVDEIRAEHGDPPLPPVPDDWTQAPGKVPQITPVGGAPNPTADTGTTDTVGSSNLSGTTKASARDLVVIHTEPHRNGNGNGHELAPAEPMQLPFEFVDAVRGIGRGLSELAARETVVRVDSPVTIAEGAVQISDGAIHSPITVEPARLEIAEGAVQVRVDPPRTEIAEGAVQVSVAPANVEMQEGMVQVRVEPPQTEIAEGAVQVHVAPTNVEIAEGAVRVDAPPPAEVNVTVEPSALEVNVGQQRPRKANARRRADGSLEVTYEPHAGKAIAKRAADGSLDVTYETEEKL